MNAVAPHYFQTMRIPMLAGRDFDWHDSPAAGSKIILNQSAAKLLFSGRNAVGEEVWRDDKTRMEVIAVVADIKLTSIAAAAPPAAYLAITQSAVSKRSYTGVIRLNGSPESFAIGIRRLISQMAPDIPAPIMTTMSRRVDMHLSTQRMMAILSVFFAACALLVTAIGLYGTLSYTTARRTSEIGIRMAVGARRLQVAFLILRENLASTAVGSIVGVGAALLAARTLTSFLYGTSIQEPWILVAAVVTLGTVAGVASVLPAIRAASVDPIKALKTE